MTSASPQASACWRPDFTGPATDRGLALTAGASLTCSPDYVHVRFSPAHSVLSCAVLGGGVVTATDFLNIRVDGDTPVDLSPGHTIERFGHGLGCDGHTVGMMTAASMKSLRVVADEVSDGSVVAVVTTGLDNARRAGDPADVEPGHLSIPPAGTINLAIIMDFDAPLATLVEMLSVAVEAKVAAMQDLGVTSPVSGRIATGTGTDAVALFTPGLSEGTLYAGKHTQLGEIVARVVLRAIESSVDSWQGR